jgi:uncharacterized cupredoxin-like copper-binding protein
LDIAEGTGPQRTRSRRRDERHRLRNDHPADHHRPRRSRIAIFAAALLLVSACSGSAPSDTSESATLIADLSDYKIVIDHPSVAAGHVVFGIRNHASMAHEFKVIKTDLAPDQLPVDAATARAREDGKVGELLDISAGATRKLALDLVPGKYVLVCNVAGHYQLGMRVGLEVK